MTSYYSNYPDPPVDINRRKRAERLASAREKGRHTKLEWAILKEIFGHCVVCGVSYDELYGGEPCKDHIEPLYCDGCDCIANLQPVCRNCNSRGIGCDFRNMAQPGWVLKYLAEVSVIVGQP